MTRDEYVYTLAQMIENAMSMDFHDEWMREDVKRIYNKLTAN